MPLIPLLLAAMLAQGAPPLDLPVSLDTIRAGLEADASRPHLRGLNEVPTFTLAVHEQSQPFTLDALLRSLAPGFTAGPVPAGGVYAYELNRVTNDATSNPLTQPYAAFSEPQLLTVLVENLAGTYLVGKTANAITSAERTRAAARARDDVQRAIDAYCAAQPDGGRKAAICLTRLAR